MWFFGSAEELLQQAASHIVVRAFDDGPSNVKTSCTSARIFLLGGGEEGGFLGVRFWVVFKGVFINLFICCLSKKICIGFGYIHFIGYYLFLITYSY